MNGICTCGALLIYIYIYLTVGMDCSGSMPLYWLAIQSLIRYVYIIVLLLESQFRHLDPSVLCDLIFGTHSF